MRTKQLPLNCTESLELLTLKKTFNIIKSNCKLNTAKFTKRSNQVTKHRPLGAFYSAAGGDVSEDKGENFNHAFLLVTETFPSGPTITPSVLFPPVMIPNTDWSTAGQQFASVAHWLLSFTCD